MLVEVICCLVECLGVKIIGLVSVYSVKTISKMIMSSMNRDSISVVNPRSYNLSRYLTSSVLQIVNVDCGLGQGCLGNRYMLLIKD
jgi:hypothetical protein